MLHPINGPRVYIESTIYIERGPRPSKYIPDPVVTKWRVDEPSEGRAEESVRVVRRGEERRGEERRKEEEREGSALGDDTSRDACARAR